MYKVGQKTPVCFSLQAWTQSKVKQTFRFSVIHHLFFLFRGGVEGGGGDGAWASILHFVLRILHYFERNNESEFSGRQIIFSLEFAGNLLMYCLGF